MSMVKAKFLFFSYSKTDQLISEVYYAQFNESAFINLK